MNRQERSMSETMQLPLTGGCQCGSVRYALHAPPADPHICHCRMCQKAFGSFFAPLAGVPLSAFELTRGERSLFHSSDQADRGFCRDCGTPLTFHYLGRDRIAVAIGSLDRPEAVPPAAQYGIEGRLSCFAALANLPDGKTPEEDAPEIAAAIRGTNQQHPDPDTAVWPPQG
jgi:hypothetical protein